MCQIPAECVRSQFSVSAGLALASILRRSQGLPATTFRGSLGDFKRSSLIWNSSCGELFCIAYDALCPFYNSLWFDTHQISLVPAGQLIHTGSNLFYQTADTYWIYLAPVRQLKQSSSNLCYLSWTTDTCRSNLHQLDNWYMLIIIIMYIYQVLINTLSAHMILN